MRTKIMNRLKKAKKVAVSTANLARFLIDNRDGVERLQVAGAFLTTQSFMARGVFLLPEEQEDLVQLIASGEDHVFVVPESDCGAQVSKVTIVGELADEYVLQHELAHRRLGHTEGLNGLLTSFSKERLVKVEVEAAVEARRFMELEGSWSQESENLAALALSSYSEKAAQEVFGHTGEAVEGLLTTRRFSEVKEAWLSLFEGREFSTRIVEEVFDNLYEDFAYEAVVPEDE